MKKQVFALANALRKTGLTLSQAFKRAWAAIKLKYAMADKAVGFYYAKEDGTERYAIGYNAVAPTVESTKPGKAVSPLVIRYYDLIANGWRSFRADRLIIG